MRTRALLGCALVLAFVVSGPAGASDAPGCGGSWSSRAACDFDPDALPLRVFADVAGAGLVRVTVSITTRATFGQTTVPILQCTAVGFETATCDRAFGPTQPFYGPETNLRCSVEGTGIGEYYCSYPPAHG